MNGTRRDGRGFPGREGATRRAVSSGLGPSGALASLLFLLLCPPLIGADGHAQERRLSSGEVLRFWAPDRSSLGDFSVRVEEAAGRDYRP